MFIQISIIYNFEVHQREPKQNPKTITTLFNAFILSCKEKMTSAVREKQAISGTERESACVRERYKKTEKTRRSDLKNLARGIRQNAVDAKAERLYF